MFRFYYPARNEFSELGSALYQLGNGHWPWTPMGSFDMYDGSN